jgi:hypothetical protein
MSEAELLTIGLSVAIVLGTAYAVVVGVGLRRQTSRQPDENVDVPRFVFKGQEFERRWQGSRGYERQETWPRENWVDLLVVPVVTNLRPSRFQDPGYWSVYLPIIWLTRFVLFVLLPILLLSSFVLGAGNSAFSPTQAQRNAVRQGLTRVPSTCTNDLAGETSSTNAVPRTKVNANEDGYAFNVDAGDLLVVSYYQGYEPTFSPNLPLCRVDVSGSSARNELTYLATGSGSGYLYFPEPGGWAYVDAINVSDTRIPVPLLVVALLVFLVDVAMWYRARKVVGPR